MGRDDHEWPHSAARLANGDAYYSIPPMTSNTDPMTKDVVRHADAAAAGIQGAIGELEVLMDALPRGPSRADVHEAVGMLVEVLGVVANLRRHLLGM